MTPDVLDSIEARLAGAQEVVARMTLMTDLLMPAGLVKGNKLGPVLADLAALVEFAREVGAQHQRTERAVGHWHRGMTDDDMNHKCTCGAVWETCPTAIAVQGLRS